MSRSYKKYPVVKDRSPSMKKLARRRFRRAINKEDFLYKGSSYKKTFESWEISDYSWTISFEEFREKVLKDWKEYGKPHGIKRPTEKEIYKSWYTIYKRK